TPVTRFSQQQSTERADSPSHQLQLEAQQHQQHPQPAYPSYENDAYDMPLDPALMQGVQHLADLPPSPFLAAQSGNADAQLDGHD
nr:hypothetical protein [Tanacetum cinerariifolium]